MPISFSRRTWQLPWVLCNVVVFCISVQTDGKWKQRIWQVSVYLDTFIWSILESENICKQQCSELRHMSQSRSFCHGCIKVAIFRLFYDMWEREREREREREGERGRGRERERGRERAREMSPAGIKLKTFIIQTTMRVYTYNFPHAQHLTAKRGCRRWVRWVDIIDWRHGIPFSKLQKNKYI